MSTVHLAVVDDEPDITRLLANYLKAHGFRVSQLHKSTALFDLMSADPPLLVLLGSGATKTAWRSPESCVSTIAVVWSS